MGANGAHNTVGKNIGAYNTVWVMSCQGGRIVLFLQVYRVRSPVLRFDLCALPFSVRFRVLTERASPIGWSQSTLIAPVGEER